MVAWIRSGHRPLADLFRNTSYLNSPKRSAQGTAFRMLDPSGDPVGFEKIQFQRGRLRKSQRKTGPLCSSRLHNGPA
jgi:hypothetical protein